MGRKPVAVCRSRGQWLCLCYFCLSLQDTGLPLFRTMIDLVSFCYNHSVVDELPVCVLTGHSRHQGLYPLSFKAILPAKADLLAYVPLSWGRTGITGAFQETCGVVYVSEKPLIDEQLFPWCEEEGMEPDRASENSGNSGSLHIDWHRRCAFLLC